MQKIDEVSDELLTSADFISAVDPRGTRACLWGDDLAPPGSASGALPHDLKKVDVRCHEGDTAEMQKIRDRVIAAKGRVSSTLADPPKFEWL